MTNIMVECFVICCIPFLYILRKTLLRNVLSLKFQEVLPDDERRDHNCEIDVIGDHDAVFVDDYEFV